MNKDMMLNIALAPLLKTSVMGAMIFSAATMLGLPVNDPWFDIFMLYVLGRWTLASIVNGMPEPDEESSDWYIWAYRSFHSMAHIATAYFSHKRMWKFISGGAELEDK